MSVLHKKRTIITQDAEVDDRNSLRHFLLYANEVEVLGIIQTSSKYHWKGKAGAVCPTEGISHSFLKEEAPFDEPYRWPGTEWMQEVLDAYAEDYPNLAACSAEYPTPDYLRSVTKIGNISYMGDVAEPTDGSELIRKAILAEDDRPLYLQVWGGANTIARALMDIRAEYENTPDWQAMREEIMKKVVILACGEQDETYRTEIAEYWPDMMFVKTLQMKSYAYPWMDMPEGESKDTLRGSFIYPNLLEKDCALMRGYCTWYDGHELPEEKWEFQFGTNPDIAKTWFGAGLHLPPAGKYDFLSEGDSPTYLPLFDWGFRTLTDFTRGGITGRYRRVPGEVNSRGEALNYWDEVMDAYTDRFGKTIVTESMWRYVADIQRDFAMRVSWAAGEEPEYAPKLSVRVSSEAGDRLEHDCSAMPGKTIRLSAVSDEGSEISYRIYPEASGDSVKNASLRTEVSGEETAADLVIPESAIAGEKVQVIVRAQAATKHRPVHYAQVIVTIRE